MIELTQTEWIFLIVSAVVMLIALKRGYKRGISREIKAVVAVIIATLCLVLILLLNRAVHDHTYGSVIVITTALIILGTGWKLVRLILSPLSGFRELGIVRAVDSLLGLVAGLIEGGALIWIAWKIMVLFEIMPERDLMLPWL